MVEYNDSAFWVFLRHHIPRILSQLDRDEDSPTFGSFDRNFWHYKIRDFSSVILQQGMLVIHALYHEKRNDNPLYRDPLARRWIDGCLRFWASQQLHNGAFNEYYPYEAGFPPTAFSLYAAGIVLKESDNMVKDAKVMRTVQKSCDWLLSHHEREATNQEAAALAGLALCQNIVGIEINAKALETRLNAFYRSQSDEGWFTEYGGPDTGYLSVTIDCLWDLYETTHDDRALTSIRNAVAYVARMISVSGHTPVMINARNTDYLVPYGLTRFAGNDPLAAAVVKRLLEKINDPDHYLNRTDDRYACHYVYPSCFRSLPYLRMMTSDIMSLPCDDHYDSYLANAGIRIMHRPGKASVFINAKKGGIVNVFDVQGVREADYGWRARTGRKSMAITHWLDKEYKVANQKDVVTVAGRMSKHAWMKPSPFKHFILRLSGLLLGYKLIPLLKRMMIFGSPSIPVSFKRTIVINDDKLVIDDHMTGKGLNGMKLYRAPHYSMRHVSSAGAFVPEELLTIEKKDLIPVPGKNEFSIRTEVVLPSGSSA